MIFNEISKRFKFIIICVLIFLMTCTGCGIFPKEEESFTPTLIKSPETTYKTSSATVGYIENAITCIGYLVPTKSVNYSFNSYTGVLKRIFVSPGDEVKKNSKLAELLTDDLENEIKLQKLKLESLQNKYSINEKLCGISLQSAKEELNHLEKNYELTKKIENAYSGNEIDDAFRAVKKQEDLIKTMELNNENTVSTIKYDIEDTKINLQKLNDQLKKSILVSSINGKVTYVTSAKQGDRVDTYSTIVTVADPNEMQLEYEGNLAGQFKLGASVELTMNYSKIMGKVVSIPSSGPSEEYEKNKYKIRVAINKIPKDMQIGDSANIKLVISSSDNAILVPLAAVHVFGENNVIYVLNDNIKVERNVKIGIKSTTMAQIIQGINPGEKVIVD